MRAVILARYVPVGHGEELTRVLTLYSICVALFVWIKYTNDLKCHFKTFLVWSRAKRDILNMLLL